MRKKKIANGTCLYFCFRLVVHVCSFGRLLVVCCLAVRCISLYFVVDVVLLVYDVLSPFVFSLNVKGKFGRRLSGFHITVVTSVTTTTAAVSSIIRTTQQVCAQTESSKQAKAVVVVVCRLLRRVIQFSILWYANKWSTRRRCCRRRTKTFYFFKTPHQRMFTAVKFYNKKILHKNL